MPGVRAAAAPVAWAAFAALLMAVGGAELLGAGGADVARAGVDLHLPRPVDPRFQMSVMTTTRGHGPAAREGDRLRVRYEGKPPSADETSAPGGPLDFVLGAGQVIAGWDEGLVGMKVGEKRKLVIPPAMAYGSRGREGVMPGERLVYQVELLAILGEGDDD